MDIEVSSLGILVTVNLIIFIGIGIYLRFFYKWDNKQYDDMAVNLDNYRRNTYGNELFHGEGASNIESLLCKDDTLVQFQGN